MQDNKAHLLTHIEASSPCTMSSVYQRARAQGVAGGFIRNMNDLKNAGVIILSDNDEGQLIIDLA